MISSRDSVVLTVVLSVCDSFVRQLMDRPKIELMCNKFDNQVK